MSAEEIIIAFQGAPGAFSHAAALEFVSKMGLDAAVVPCQTFGEVFSLVMDGKRTYGAIPLENSSIGSIVANYDLLWEYEAFLIAEHLLPVHHQLIGLPGSNLDEITQVFSHPAALDQCRKLFREYENLIPRVHWDTSGAVVHIKETGDRHFAAIAGALAAEEYGMEILAENVEDYAHNSTRFGLIIANDRAMSDTAIVDFRPESERKLSIAFELEHKPGALSGLLSHLSASGANLTKIESRPMGETPWHYRFFIDLEVASAESESAIGEALDKGTLAFKLLGRYSGSAGGSPA